MKNLEKLEQDKDDPKKFWRSVNQLTGLGKSKTKKGLQEIITKDGISHKGLDAANFMNENYTNAGPKLASNFCDVWNSSDCNIESPQNRTSLSTSSKMIGLV